LSFSVLKSFSRISLRSSKILIGNDQFYSSRAAQLENKPSELMDGYLEIENNNIINKDNLIIDIDHLLMYKK
jgi:hypothetical protein